MNLPKYPTLIIAGLLTVVGGLLAVFSGLSVQTESSVIKELRSKAEKGDAKAQEKLGHFFYFGDDASFFVEEFSGIKVPVNYTEASKWYRKAAEQGVDFAQYMLGQMYYNGQGVPKDFTEAEKWYRKAAEQGKAGAQCSLGKMYNHGQGVRANFTEAVKWYRKAAEQGIEEAQRILEVEGRLRSRAEQGDVNDIRAFAIAHEIAIDGVPRDLTEACKWHRRAAELGNESSQLSLGKAYYFGEGVPKDLTEAYAYWNIAGSRGSEIGRKNLEALEKKMDSWQIEKGQQRSRELLKEFEAKTAGLKSK